MSYQRDGSYLRRTDGRRVARFRCLVCRRRFSSQSFRLDYREQKPAIDRQVLACLVSKVTHRQTARILHIDRKTVHRRLARYGEALRRWHDAFLERARSRGGIGGTFSLDELETYEHDRRIMPVTVPVLIQRETRFIIHLETGDLPARGGLSPIMRKRKWARERAFGRRRNGSRRAVDACVAALSRIHDERVPLSIVTDRKSSYPVIIRRWFGSRIGSFVRVSSHSARDVRNPMFPINHTFAMMRDQVSRLVRRNWGSSKRQSALRTHLWIYAAWRNYVRPMFNRTPDVSSAMALGMARRRYRPSELLRWRWPDLMPTLTN